ncbi:MAG: hypothetical protein QM820_32630 [Minicystis sp.]
MLRDTCPPLVAVLLACAACNTPPAAPATPAPIAATATVTAAPTTTAAAQPPLPSAVPVTSSEPPAPTASAAPSGPAPYPQAWIDEAVSANDALTCRELIYWQGCHQTRTGAVTVEITLAPDGKVERVEPIENTVRHQPEVVWRCLKQKLPRWKMHAPAAVSPTFRHTFRFADKC